MIAQYTDVVERFERALGKLRQTDADFTRKMDEFNDTLTMKVVLRDFAALKKISSGVCANSFKLQPLPNERSAGFIERVGAFTTQQHEPNGDRTMSQSSDSKF